MFNARAAVSGLGGMAAKRAASKKRNAGYTLVETMVASSVLAVLTAAGVPSYSSIISRQAVLSEVAEFQEAVGRARLEAVRRGETVTLCARAPDSPLEGPHCAAEGRDWTSGWMIFVDRSERGEMDPGDLVLHVHQASAKVGAINSTLRTISFQPLGISSSAASRFQFRPLGASPTDANPSNSRLVCVSKPGRTRVLSTAACA
jgi:type IV fimbrial biogenesis protein FimT